MIMNRIKQVLFLLSIVVLFTSCNICNHHHKSKKMNLQNMEVYLEPTTDRTFEAPEGEVNYKIKNAEIKDNILTINITYSGGCKPHNFELMFNGMFMKSLPRKAGLYLKHESNGDLCKKLILLELKYDLSSIVGEAKQAANFSLFSYPEVLKYNQPE